jgi:hypothetical protein
MTWLLLRLYRRPIALLILLALGTAAALLASASTFSQQLDTTSVRTCLEAIRASGTTPVVVSPPPKTSSPMTPSPSSDSPSQTCSPGAQQALDSFGTVENWLKIALEAMPLILALFVSVPLVGREFERGTNRLLWTQSLTPTNWLVRLVLTALAFCVALTGIVSLAGGPWRALEVDVMNSQWPVFDVTPTVMLAYAFFGVALGVAAATVAGRTVVAMIATLVCWLGIRVAVGDLMRPRFISPLIDRTMTSGTAGHNWFLSVAYVDRSGTVLSDDQVFLRTGQQYPDPDVLAAHGISLGGLYQPAARFVAFQGIEAAVFVLLALACLILALVYLRVRVSSK